MKKTVLKWNKKMLREMSLLNACHIPGLKRSFFLELVEIFESLASAKAYG